MKRISWTANGSLLQATPIPLLPGTTWPPLIRTLAASGDAIPLHETNYVASTPGRSAGQPDFLAQPNEVAVVQQDKRWVRQVILLHERTRADGRRTIGPGHPDSLGYRNNLATAYLEAGRIREAADLLEHTWEDKKEEKTGFGRPQYPQVPEQPGYCVPRDWPHTASRQVARQMPLPTVSVHCGSTHGTTEIVRRTLPLLK